MSRSRAHAPAQPHKDGARPVSKPRDTHEREADRAADVVGRGGSVAGWSFSSVPTSAPVQRQEVVKEKSEDDKKKEALKKAGEAALETPQGKAVKEKVLADPLVKTVKDAVTSTPGLIAAGAALGGGVAALAATGKELPIQPPEIPLEKLSKKFEGMSAQITYEGPLNKPTFVGLSLTIKEQGPKPKKKDEKSAYAAETARIKSQQELFKPQSQKDAEKKEGDDLVQAWVAQQKFPGAPTGLTIPLTPPPAQKEEKKEPVQPAPASATAAPPARAKVDDALSTPGRPLDAGARRAMEARFGHDFSRVRVHDDARAAATAQSIDAAAFTLGEEVVFAPGRYDPASDEGRRLLAHELTHVVQQAHPDRAPTAGRPLDPKQRAFFERRLGVGLGDVRIHAGDDASAAAARRLGARAYTVGDDIVFGKGQYDAATPRGRWLLAHELAHVAQARQSAGTTAVEADASAAATAAVTGTPVKVAARRSAAEPSKFGEPDNTPDLTFISTSGGQGFLREATQYHRTWGLAPQSFSSLQGLLATLAQGTGTINRLRIVSHANYDNIFTPLFDGGASGITEQDLLAWGESDVAGMRRALDGPLVTGDLRALVITNAAGASPAIFASFGIDPANPPTSGPLGQLLDAAVDLLIVRSSEDMPAAQRTRFDAALSAELDAARAAVVTPGTGGGTAATPAQAQSLQDAITGATGFSGGMQAQHADVMRKITAATGGVTHGFRANLNAVRARLMSSSWVDIRGCRVGQRQAYLTAVSTFFGGPHVSGPDLWQRYPQLGWHSVPEAGLAQKATEANVLTALDHWADVTGVRSRLAWWLSLLRRILIDESIRSLQETQSLLRPPSLLGGLRLNVDPLMMDFSGEMPPLPRLEQPTFGAGIGYQPPAPTVAPGMRLQNPLVPVAQRDLARYGGSDGLFKYYMDVGLPLPVQEGANVQAIYLTFKVGLERNAIDAWTASEWDASAPGLAAVQSGAWTRDAIRQVEAVSDEDAARNVTALYVSPDPLYAAHIQSV